MSGLSEAKQYLIDFPNVSYAPTCVHLIMSKLVAEHETLLDELRAYKDEQQEFNDSMKVIRVQGKDSPIVLDNPENRT